MYARRDMPDWFIGVPVILPSVVQGNAGTSFSMSGS